LHGSAHAVLQQYPSTQLPSAQSPGAEHVRPLGFSAWHDPLLQKGAAAPQCASAVHVV
jgi:hypothetical protein